jgi:hypothetical protein
LHVTVQIRRTKIDTSVKTTYSTYDRATLPNGLSFIFPLKPQEILKTFNPLGK